jgi:tetratricopeptide (TPR) repeat protein
VVEARSALAYSIEANEPMRTAGLHSMLASDFLGLGRVDSALVHAQAGVEMSRRIYAPDHHALADALGRLAEVRTSLAQYPEAIAAQEEAVRILRRKGPPGENLAFELAVLGSIQQSAGQLDAAIRSATEALAIYRASLGSGHFRAGETMANLANYHQQAGHAATADTLFRDALAILDANHDQTVVSPVARVNYANLCLDLGRLAEADRLLTRATSALDSTNASMRSYCGDGMLTLARVRLRQGRNAQADSLAATGFRLRRGDLAESDPQLLDSWLTLAEIRWVEGSAGEAVSMLARAKRSGASDADVARYPQLLTMRKRSDYPFVNSP